MAEARARGIKPKVASKGRRIGTPVEAPTVALPTVGRIPAGWRVIGAREFGEHLLSVRFLLLIGLMGIVGVLVIYTLAGNIRDVAGSLRDQLRFFSGESFPLFLFLFSQPPVQGDTSLAANIPSFAAIVATYVGPLLGLAFGFDAISNERSEGTLPRLVSQPIHRDDVINGKFVASLAVVALILGAVMLILAGIGIYRLGIVPTGDTALRLFAWWVFLVLYVGFWLALAMLCSVIFRRGATAVLVVLATWIVLTLFGGQIVSVITGLLHPLGSTSTTADQIANANLQLSLHRLLPSGMFADVTAVMLNPALNSLSFTATDPTGRAIPGLLPFTQSLLLIWPQAVSLLALTLGCFAAAYVIFMRQEVRA